MNSENKRANRSPEPTARSITPTVGTYFFARPVAGFRPRYRIVLLSTFVGFVAITVVHLLLSLLPIMKDEVIWTGICALSGWLTMSLCHATIIRGTNQERITYLKAFALTMIQVIAAFVLWLILINVIF